MELWMGVAITSIVGSGVGSFLGAYLKKKGENLATQEDVDKIVSQVAAVTRTTKEIESKIDSATWDRQKQWELRREVLFEVTKQTALVKDALCNLEGAYRSAAGKPERLNEKVKEAVAWQDASKQLDQIAALAQIVCGEELQKLVLQFDIFSRNVSQRIMGEYAGAFNEHVKRELVERLDAIRAATRRELGLTP